MKKAIAMKCTQEQFDAVKGKLENINSITNFKEWPYLVNCDSNKTISNIHKSSFDWVWDENPEIHETWNEEIFLNACGIKTDYRITKEQIIKLHKNEGSKYVKEWFPEVFKTELEVGKWYFHLVFNALVNYQGGSKGYGFKHNGTWNDLIDYWSFKTHTEEWRKATSQEVETALIAEAKKRGYIKSSSINTIRNCQHENNIEKISSDKFDYEEVPAGIFEGQMALRDSDGNIIFVNGTWATIIPTITKKEAEEKLNCKIVD